MIRKEILDRLQKEVHFLCVSRLIEDKLAGKCFTLVQDNPERTHLQFSRERVGVLAL